MQSADQVLRIAITTPLECSADVSGTSTTHTFTSTVSPGRKEGTFCFICSCSLLNNVAHNLPYPGKLIFKWRHPIMFMLLLCVFCFEPASNLCFALQSEPPVFSRSSGLLPCSAIPATVSTPATYLGMVSTAISLAVLPYPLTLQGAYMRTIQQTHQQTNSIADVFMPRTPV